MIQHLKWALTREKIEFLLRANIGNSVVFDLA